MAKKIDKQDDEIKESLLVKKTGYLKIPKKVRDNYGNPKEYPNPTASAQETMGHLVLTYIFPLKEMGKKGKEEQDKD